MEVMNSICHWEMPSTDFDRSRVFYEALFGWKTQAMPEMDYMLFEVEGGVGGGFTKVDVVTDAGVIVYIRVEDIPAVLAKVPGLGGEILEEKTPVAAGEFGYIGIFRDSCGVRIGLWSKE